MKCFYKLHDDIKFNNKFLLRHWAQRDALPISAQARASGLEPFITSHFGPNRRPSHTPLRRHRFPLEIVRRGAKKEEGPCAATAN